MPIRELAHSAEVVSRSSEKRNAIPDLSNRDDEIGDLSIALKNMTHELYARVEDVADFAADVAHEIKNPLTSLRSASDTLKLAKTKDQRDKLIDIIQNDVIRMNRLITDISKASKVDADIARDQAQIMDMNDIANHLVSLYQQIHTKGHAKITLCLLYTSPSPRDRG